MGYFQWHKLSQMIGRRRPQYYKNTKKIELRALIDTGSPITAIRSEDAEDFEKKDTRLELRTISGSMIATKKMTANIKVRDRTMNTVTIYCIDDMPFQLIIGRNMIQECPALLERKRWKGTHSNHLDPWPVVTSSKTPLIKSPLTCRHVKLMKSRTDCLTQHWIVSRPRSRFGSILWREWNRVIGWCGTILLDHLN